MESTAVQVATQENTLQWAARFMNDGGVFMWIILVVWCIGIAIAVERLRHYFKYDTDGKTLMGNIRKNVLSNEVQMAIQTCSDSSALISFVMKNGLKRANQSKEQISDALEASILEVVPMIEKRLAYIALMANLSTLLGLLGTIQGLIQSFAAVANAEASQKAQLLAEGIALAMNTTAFGLISAISLMVVHAFLMSKGDKMIKEIEENSVKLLDLLNTKKSSQVQAPSQAA